MSAGMWKRTPQLLRLQHSRQAEQPSRRERINTSGAKRSEKAFFFPLLSMLPSCERGELGKGEHSKEHVLYQVSYGIIKFQMRQQII